MRKKGQILCSGALGKEDYHKTSMRTRTKNEISLPSYVIELPHFFDMPTCRHLIVIVSFTGQDFQDTIANTVYKAVDIINSSTLKNR